MRLLLILEISIIVDIWRNYDLAILKNILLPITMLDFQPFLLRYFILLSFYQFDIELFMAKFFFQKFKINRNFYLINESFLAFSWSQIGYIRVRV